MVFDKIAAIQPDFRSHYKSGPFETKPLINHSKYSLVRISDPHCIFIFIALPHSLHVAQSLKQVSNMSYSIQFNLFGGTVLRLGTARHHDKLLAGIDNLEEVGCFGLTELGYGNNAVEMETTATYDPATGKIHRSLQLRLRCRCERHLGWFLL